MAKRSLLESSEDRSTVMNGVRCDFPPERDCYSLQLEQSCHHGYYLRPCKYRKPVGFYNALNMSKTSNIVARNAHSYSINGRCIASSSSSASAQRKRMEELKKAVIPAQTAGRTRKRKHPDAQSVSCSTVIACTCSCMYIVYIVYTYIVRDCTCIYMTLCIILLSIFGQNQRL